jgi:hypothetical protein
MSNQSTCKWCGADAITHDNGWRAACGSWDFGWGLWSRGEGCLLRSKVAECDELRQRIDAAVKALQDITRHEVDADDQFGILSEYNEHGHWVEWDDLDDVVKILRRNAPTNSEGLE